MFDYGIIGSSIIHWGCYFGCIIVWRIGRVMGIMKGINCLSGIIDIFGTN